MIVNALKNSNLSALMFIRYLNISPWIWGNWLTILSIVVEHAITTLTAWQSVQQRTQFSMMTSFLMFYSPIFIQCLSSNAFLLPVEVLWITGFLMNKIYYGHTRRLHLSFKSKLSSLSLASGKSIHWLSLSPCNSMHQLKTVLMEWNSMKTLRVRSLLTTKKTNRTWKYNSTCGL